MNHTRSEMIVGLFVLVGIACLGYLAIKLGKLEVFGASGLLRGVLSCSSAMVLLVACGYLAWIGWRQPAQSSALAEERPRLAEQV